MRPDLAPEMERKFLPNQALTHEQRLTLPTVKVKAKIGNLIQRYG